MVFYVSLTGLVLLSFAHFTFALPARNTDTKPLHTRADPDIISPAPRLHVNAPGSGTSSSKPSVLSGIRWSKEDQNNRDRREYTPRANELGLYANPNRLVQNKIATVYHDEDNKVIAKSDARKKENLQTHDVQ